MRYPTISQYIDSLEQSSYFCQSLQGVALLRDKREIPIYNSGNFGVVFSCEHQGERFALKCFTREGLQRREAYEKICRGLPNSKYLLRVELLSDEIMAAPLGSSVIENYDVLKMEYVEGNTLAQEIYNCVALNDSRQMADYSHKFNELALWLLDQDFAHCDLKPENIVVRGENKELVLVDYDGVYTPEMRGERQREIGTRSYQHPKRPEMRYEKGMDDYSILLLSVSLYFLSLNPGYYNRFSTVYSPLVINSADASRGQSSALNYIEQCGLLPEWICRMFESESAVLDRLVEAVGVVDELVRRQIAFQDDKSIDELVPFECNGKWGYENQDACEVIACRYDMCWEFDSEGMALVRYRGRYGFIDREGNRVINFRFEYASPFSEGLAVACIKGRYGYVDRKGKWVVRPRYDYARPVRNGISIVELNGKIFEL